MVLELFDLVLELFDEVVLQIGAIGRFILIVRNGPRTNRIDRSARSANYSDWSECQIGTDRCGPGSCSSGSWNKSGRSVWSVCSDEQVVDVGLGCVRSLRADRSRIDRSLDSDHSDEQGVDVRSRMSPITPSRPKPNRSVAWLGPFGRAGRRRRSRMSPSTPSRPPPNYSVEIGR